MFDGLVVEVADDRPVVFAPPVRELVLLLAAAKADPLLICFARNLYALHDHQVAMAFVLRWAERPL